MTKSEAENYVRKVAGWILSEDGKKIFREFTFKDFKKAMQFVNAVAELAESEGHHPDIYIFWNRVRLELWTHAINGLSENDFILAAKINKYHN
jgi:4a-hydroxytetrahydrobiopterin dehydratase